MRKALLVGAILALAAVGAVALGPALFGENFRTVVRDRVKPANASAPPTALRNVRRSIMLHLRCALTHLRVVAQARVLRARSSQFQTY